MKKKKSPYILNKTIFRFITLIVFFGFNSCLFSSCDSSKRINTGYVYFNDGTDTVAFLNKEIVIQPNDVLSIQVFSRTLNQEQVAIFNIAASANPQNQGYQVNSYGNIALPVIGNVKAEGLTKDQLQTSLVEKLTEYVKNPSVVVKFLQFNINVLGEVRAPGTQRFLVDKVTIIDAISAAGDLTDHGKRENIKVIREERGQKITYLIDLRSNTAFKSQAYLLQPNDIVYVSPDDNKLRSLSVNPDAQRRTGLFFGILSAVLSVATLVLFSVKK